MFAAMISNHPSGSHAGIQGWSLNPSRTRLLKHKELILIYSFTTLSQPTTYITLLLGLPDKVKINQHDVMQERWSIPAILWLFKTTTGCIAPNLRLNNI